MSILNECKTAELSKIRGAASLPDEFDRSVYASQARNCEFVLDEQVATRRGFAEAWNPNKSITRLFNWILAGANRLAYYNKTDGNVTLRNLGTGAETNVLTGQAAQYADFASLGSRLLFAVADSSGNGAGQARIWDSATAPVTADKAFEPPLSSLSFSISQPGTGTVSRGTHRFLVVFTTRTGYETRPCPVRPGFTSSGAFADAVPASFIAVANKNLRVSISPPGAWPASYTSAALLMTTAQNPARFFFVPGCTATVFGGSSATVTFPDIDISDTILAAKSSVEAVSGSKNYFALWSQDSVGSGPFNPFGVLGYSDRACYLTTLSDGTSGLVVSNKNAPQWVTLASHLIQLPEKRQMTTFCVLKNSLYIFGPGWTYSVSDNAALPVSWVPPQEIDGRIGSPSPTGVCANSSAGYAWVADTSGLYLFQGGSYPNRPVSFLNTPDWERINWAAPAGTLQVLDYPARKQVWVAAPLDGATSANFIMVWDYANGTGWDKVNYSLWSSGAWLDIGALANVYNPTKKVFDVYISRYGAGKVYRSKSVAAGDVDLYSDDTAGIFSIYKSCALPKVFHEPVQMVALKLRLRGNGTLQPIIDTLDSGRSVLSSNIVAVNAPGQSALMMFDIQSEAIHLLLSNNGVAGAWFLISGIKTYWTDWMAQR